MENIQNCPICGGNKFALEFTTKDYFLSQESFSIEKCQTCGFQITNPRPAKEAISSYYKSEDYISHSNKSKGLFARLYQLARKVNLSSKYSIIGKHAHKGRLLDIGSGTGHFLNYFQKKQWPVQGIEPNEEAARFARENFGLKIDSEQNISKIPDHSFDVITMWHVLEHVHDLNQRMLDLQRLIKPKGLLVLALPNPESYDSKYYVKYWAAYDLPRHLYHFRKSDVEKLAKKYNFRIEKIYPMRLDAFYVSLLSEKYIGKKQGTLRAIYTAFLSNLKNTAQNPNTSSLIYILRPN
jgi:2-polyprenyl-3-methyl-5-hydroxy-6-metoxy-1,4-benzoquinol methylase